MVHFQLGLIGKKLGHSFSKQFFTEKFRDRGLFAEYLNFEIPEIMDFPEVLSENPLLRGLNVTIPYKTAIIPYLHGLDEQAAAIGAVNTILIENGYLKGFNTDVIGFRDSLAQRWEGGPGGKALILGTGGASRAAEYALTHYFSFESIQKVSRTPQADVITYQDLKMTHLGEYSLIVNCTPVGMFPNEDAAPNLNFDQIGPGQLLYDMIYRPEETRFLAEGKRRGADICNGMDMLLRQAEAAWAIWSDGWIS